MSIWDPHLSPAPGGTAKRRQALRAAQAKASHKTNQAPAVRLPSHTDRYGSDVLSVNPHRVGSNAIRPQSVHMCAHIGLVVEDRETGFVGAVVAVEKSGGRHIVVLEDRYGTKRGFTLGAGFWFEGRPIILDPPAQPRKTTAPVSFSGRKLTASGSYAIANERARTARASRIWVEGKHDAQLIEKVWGDDLRHEGVVVLQLDGVDNLAQVMAEFAPSATRRAGVLVDHLIPGSKEQRLAAQVQAMPGGENILILGHPYIDVWQAVKPQRLGLESWPDVERGIDFKYGTLQALGWAHANQADVAHGWLRILNAVHGYKDLEPALLGCMEALIDFVTAPGTC